MPPFRYTPTTPDATGSIGELLLRRGQIAAEQARQVGAAQAQAQQASGQAWAGAAQNIGQIAAGAMQSYAQERREAPIRAQEAAIRQGTINSQTAAAGDHTRGLQERSAFDQALKDSMVTNPDTGLTTYDRKKAQQIVVGGGMGHLWPQISEILDASDAADTALTKAQETAILKSVSLIDAAGNDPSFALHEIQRGITNHRYSEQQAAPYLDLIQRGGQQALAQITAHLLGKKPDLMAVNPGDVVIDKNNPGAGAAFTAPPKPPDAAPNPTEASLAAAAAKGDPSALKALGLLRAQQPPRADTEPLVQIMGPQGTPIWVKRSDAVNKPAAQAPRAVTGAERQALAFYNRAQSAIDDISSANQSGVSLEDRVAKGGLATQAGLQYAPNILQTKDQQAYRQAQRAFTEARLRKESGAAINNAEYEKDSRTYFAQPGDDKETIDQKRKARAVVLDGLRYGSGKAYDEYYGEPAPKAAAQKDPLGIRD